MNRHHYIALASTNAHIHATMHIERLDLYYSALCVAAQSSDFGYTGFFWPSVQIACTRLWRLLLSTFAVFRMSRMGLLKSAELCSYDASTGP